MKTRVMFLACLMFAALFSACSSGDGSSSSMPSSPNSNPIAVNGACGVAAKNYPSSTTDWGSDKVCSSGTANPFSPEFPTAGGSSHWSCDGSNGGATISCSASRDAVVVNPPPTPTPVNGSCGTAAQAYPNSATSWGANSMCSVGTANPLSPAFPSAGSLTAWDCIGSNGGTTAPCSASRATAPIVEYLARPLPAKGIYVMEPTSGRWTPTAIERINFIHSMTVKTKAQGLTGVNLVLDWKDLEPQQGQIDFATLDAMISDIKSNGLYCILRVYANVEQWQAWPAWVAPAEAYDVAGNATKNILPWDSKYQMAFEAFHASLNQHFVSSKIQPDAMQISIGGGYGEEVLTGYDYVPFFPGNDGYDQYFDKLSSAEIAHLNFYARTVKYTVKSSIVMVNSLYPQNVVKEDLVSSYARQVGFDWIQSNGGACFMTTESWGDAAMKMLARFKSGGAKIFLEDESGPWACPQAGISDASIINRIKLMQNLQTKYGLTFDAVSINGYAGTINGYNQNDIGDTAGILELKKFLGI